MFENSGKYRTINNFFAGVMGPLTRFSPKLREGLDSGLQVHPWVGLYELYIVF
jgi:hypothetical protein